jgi:hypothetical protein
MTITQFTAMACKVPELSPMEQVREIIGRRVEDFLAPIDTLAALRVQIQRASDEIPQAEIDYLILIMPWRLNECIRLRGDTIHYYFFNILNFEHKFY